MTAAEAVDRLNSEGAGLVVGERLPSSAGVRTFALELREEGHPEEEHPEEATEGHHHAGGSVADYPDARSAEAELANCRRSATASGGLYCVQIDNVLVILGGDIPPAELAAVLHAARVIVD